MRSLVLPVAFALMFGTVLPATALAGPPVLLPDSFVRVRADNHFGVAKQHEIFPTFGPGFSDSIDDQEVGTAAVASNTATYDISVTGTTSVFDIQSQQTYSVGSTGNLSEGFLHVTLDEPYVYELSGNWTGSGTDAGDACQQRTFLRQFVSPFTTNLLEDETAVGASVFLRVNRTDDTVGGTYNQSGTLLGVLPPGTYEFNYELEGRDDDVDQAGSSVSNGRVRLVLRKPLPPADLEAVTSGLSVTLSWLASLDATAYQLEAGSAPGLSDLFVGDVGNLTQLQAAVPAGIYFVRLRSKRAPAIGPASAEVTFAVGNPSCSGPPLAPTGHIAQGGGLSAIVRWNSSVGATSYVLEAGSGPGLSNLFSGNVGGRTLIAASPGAGTYFTRVRAVNTCGASAPSNEVSMTVTCAPPAPTGLRLTRSGNVVAIEWFPSLGALSYILQVGTGPGLSNGFNGNVGAVTTMSAGLAGVPAGTYFVRTLAVGSCATSGASNEASITLP